MKKLAILAFAAFVFCGCEKDNDPPRPNPDPDPDPVEESGINRWVYNVMKENYLWAGNMPSFEDGDANIPTKQYFDEKLRYRDNRSVAYRYDTYGDRFSYIEKTSPGTRAEEVGMVYDAGFIPVTLSSSTTEDILFLQVCYVTPGSPADGKLKRGDAFRSINGTVVTYDNIHRLLSARTMEIEVFDIESTGYRTVTLSCDGYYPQPIVADIIYDDRNTAYLAYTDFVMEGQSGPTGSMSALREAFARYKAAGVRNLILDLRYNGGGVRNVTILLASLIARSSDLGQVFMYSRYNTGEYEQYDLLDPSQVTENADIETLVVLTSNSTASASELIINCLKPYYGNNMSVIGETTVGKNVGSRTYVNERWGWEINPIDSSHVI